ncbi:MAG: bifunctional transcriptional activator/DNA repair enzyme AdaA [bacterium]
MPSDYSRIEAAIRFIDDNLPEQPNLDAVAASAGLSPFHFQRLFRRWAGVSPKRFLEVLTVEQAKRLLAESRSVLDTAYDVGLSSPGRLHDHFVSIEAVTPGEFKSRGAGLAIRYGVHESPFGRALLATTDRGICALSFVNSMSDVAEEVDALRARWSGARVTRDTSETRAIAAAIFAGERATDSRVTTRTSTRTSTHRAADRWPLLVMGTNFQVQVWRALLQIPEGSVVSYEQVGRLANHAGASRAVGSAVGANCIAYLIPCHRVIRSVGATGDYRWGAARKRALLAWEFARADVIERDSSSARALRRRPRAG